METLLVYISCALCFCKISVCDANCDQVFEWGVGPSDQANILQFHNYLRSAINEGKVPGQPKAKGLRPLEWDDKLAHEAEIIAETCVDEHVKVNDARFHVGQNLRWTGSSESEKGADWTGTIQKWFNEYKHFKYPNTSRDTGHYTQIVSENTRYIGCGYIMYSEKGGWYEKLYVCNYGPEGNIDGQPPYRVF